MFLMGFVFGSLVVYLICMEESNGGEEILPMWANTSIAVGLRGAMQPLLLPTPAILSVFIAILILALSTSSQLVEIHVDIMDCLHLSVRPSVHPNHHGEKEAKRFGHLSSNHA